MKARYRLIRRGLRGGAFQCVDAATGQRTGFGTNNEDDARQITFAKNLLNLQIAKAYLAGSNSGVTTRTWQQGDGKN